LASFPFVIFIKILFQPDGTRDTKLGAMFSGLPLPIFVWYICNKIVNAQGKLPSGKKVQLGHGRNVADSLARFISRGAFQIVVLIIILNWPNFAWSKGKK
jgi:hypothetical protein